MKLQLEEEIRLTPETVGKVKYIGPVLNKGIHVGMELNTPKGKNDGSLDGVRYFTCAPNHGIFVEYKKLENKIVEVVWKKKYEKVSAYMNILKEKYQSLKRRNDIYKQTIKIREEQISVLKHKNEELTEQLHYFNANESMLDSSNTVESRKVDADSSLLNFQRDACEKGVFLNEYFDNKKLGEINSENRYTKDADYSQSNKIYSKNSLQWEKIEPNHKGSLVTNITIPKNHKEIDTLNMEDKLYSKNPTSKYNIGPDNLKINKLDTALLCKDNNVDSRIKRVYKYMEDLEDEVGILEKSITILKTQDCDLVYEYKQCEYDKCMALVLEIMIGIIENDNTKVSTSVEKFRRIMSKYGIEIPFYDL